MMALNTSNGLKAGLKDQVVGPIVPGFFLVLARRDRLIRSRLRFFRLGRKVGAPVRHGQLAFQCHAQIEQRAFLKQLSPQGYSLRHSIDAACVIRSARGQFSSP